MPLTLRLSLTYLVLTLAGLLLLGGGFVVLAGRYLSDQREQALAAQAGIYAALLGELADSPQALQALAVGGVGRELLPTGTDVRLFATSGARLAGDPALGPFPSRSVLALVHPSIPLLASQVADRSYAARAIRVDGTTIGVLELSRSDGDDRLLLTSLGSLVVQAAIISGGLMALAGVLVARSIARPIVRQSCRAEVLAQRFGADMSLSALPHRDEIGQLAANLTTLEQGLDAYTTRIRELEQARARFYRSVSHDLRTPLTAISGMLENQIDLLPPDQQAPLAMIDTEVSRLSRLVDELLRPPDDGQLLITQRSQVRLAPLAAELVALLAGRARRAGLHLECAVAAELCVVGDRDRLKQALLNLLDNALRVTPPGGTVELRALCVAKTARLMVVDSGPGVASALREQIWQRGVRGEQPGSSGLGLAIVREIATA
ncbi:MAG: HAMP domain-containing histidine kinase, partial [Oscillochloris sp.]|nr:HAMP domain-containing histidine kinase [Oscillochloris sp.]